MPLPEHATEYAPPAGVAFVAREHELQLVAALRAGDEKAFSQLFDAHHAALVRLAARYVPSVSIADEVAQEAWLSFLQSLDRFEGRSSIKTWLFRTLLNCARSRKRAENHSVPFSATGNALDDREPLIDERRFRPDGAWAGHWAVAPRSFAHDGERRLLQGELRVQLQTAVDALPPAQREVIVLRDIEGFSSLEVCEVLGVSEANQRVLLHRARTRLRSELEQFFESEHEPTIGGAS